MGMIMRGTVLSLVVADPRPLVRARIHEMALVDGICRVVADARTGLECIDLVKRLKPAAALFSDAISTPGPLEVLRAISSSSTRIGLLVEGCLTPALHEAFQAAKTTFIQINCPGDIRRALQSMAADSFDDEVTTASRLPAGELGRATESCQRLTTRQRQIVDLVTSGLSNKQVAQRLGLSEGTVKVHLHTIYQRIGVAGRTGLAKKEPSP